jgi:hypothetical protein
MSSAMQRMMFGLAASLACEKAVCGKAIVKAPPAAQRRKSRLVTICSSSGSDTA